jgi:hypothetical protein
MPLGADGKTPVPGCISIEHTVWCGTCDVWMQLPEPNKTSMAKAVLRRGWRRHDEHVWQCPNCVRRVVPA